MLCGLFSLTFNLSRWLGVSGRPLCASESALFSGRRCSKQLSTSSMPRHCSTTSRQWGWCHCGPWRASAISRVNCSWSNTSSSSVDSARYHSWISSIHPDHPAASVTSIDTHRCGSE